MPDPAGDLVAQADDLAEDERGSDGADQRDERWAR
jgi:hypothetical protein